MKNTPTKKDSCSIVALDRFIQATRDSGYKGTASAISELVDNSIQAGATRIRIIIRVASDAAVGAQLEVLTIDDGRGMDPFTLRQALRFGGSTRFSDRSGLGRYGMGLPNASLSQARRLTVFTWQRAAKGDMSRVHSSYLDVDEIVRGEIAEVPRPRVVRHAPPECEGKSGTLVAWTSCDRLDNRRPSTIARKLAEELGRRFRHFLWNGLTITINDLAVTPVDPLFLHTKGRFNGAHVFGEPLEYEIAADPADPAKTGWVTVRFAELPVHEWYRLSNEEKRRIGVAKGAGVSVVRGGREVDYGWFFMGAKRRENYDDWWRCEIQFDPVLDEAFGITHTKQQVRPQPHLVEALTTDMEAMARALNSRARKAHLAAKVGERFSEAERLAQECDARLKPLPAKASPRSRAQMQELERVIPSLRTPPTKEEERSRYRIVEGNVRDRAGRDTCFFNQVFDGDRVVLVLNPDHPFYREIYKPLAEGDSPRDQQLRAKLELLLLAAARSEISTLSRTKGRQLPSFRQEWSNTLATFLNG